MDKREQAKQNALAKFVETYHSNDEHYPILEKVALLDGFDAGHAAADEWVAIEDGLPKYTDHYLVVINGVTWMAFWAACEDGSFIWQDVNPDNGESLTDVIAWKPLPKPYQRPNDEEKKNDA